MLHPMPSWACCLPEYVCVGGTSDEGILVMIGLALDSVQFTMLDIRVEFATT